MEKGRIGQITGDIAGGASTAVYGLPGNIVFGLIAFASLLPMIFVMGYGLIIFG